MIAAALGALAMLVGVVAAQKIAGWITVCIATIVGAIGAACLVGALGGRDFDLSWRERSRYAIAGIILCAVAAWLVIHVAAPTLRYAQEASWREDYQRVSNGDQTFRVAGLAMHKCVSPDFTGYWQRHC